jgi:hypothetical protein
VILDHSLTFVYIGNVAANPFKQKGKLMDNGKAGAQKTSEISQIEDDMMMSENENYHNMNNEDKRKSKAEERKMREPLITEPLRADEASK